MHDGIRPLRPNDVLELPLSQVHGVDSDFRRRPTLRLNIHSTHLGGRRETVREQATHGTRYAGD